MHAILHLSQNVKLIYKTMSEIEVTFMIIHVKIIGNQSTLYISINALSVL